MASIEHVLQLTPEEKKKYQRQRRIMSIAKRTPLRSDESLYEGTPGRISRETKSKMGVKDIRLHAPLAEDPEYPAHKALVEGIMSTNEETGAVTSDVDQANIIFMRGSDKDAYPGMLEYTGAYHQGVNGVAIREEREETEAQMPMEELWRTLGHSATKYAIQPLVAGSDYVGHDLGSMEGAMHRSDVRNGYLDFTERLGYMAASEYVTRNETVDPVDIGDDMPRGMHEVRAMCSALREFKFMPPLNLEDIVPEQRAELLKRFLGQSGLSTGNASFWDRNDNVMMITASGVDKGNLKPHEILRIQGFTNSFDGVKVQPYTFDGKVKTSKASVESFGNLATYFASIGVESGDIREGSLDEVLGFIQDEELVRARLEEGYQPRYIRQLHFHAHPVAWNPRLVTVVEPNANLVHGGDAHASCGTRPEAYYTTEMGVRGMLYNEDEPKIVIAKMQKHGSEVISPFDLEKTLRILNPYRAFPDTFFAPVEMGINPRK